MRANELLQKEYASLPLTEPYGSFIGGIWIGFQILLWGIKGSGKSTQSLLIAASLVPHAIAVDGTVMVLAAEEGQGPGIKKRLARLGLDDEAIAKHIEVAEWRGLSDFKKKMERENAKWVIIDSVSKVGFSGSEEEQLIDWMKRQGIGGIWVAHSLKDGEDYKGVSEVGHEVDAVIRAYQDEEGRFKLESQKNRAKDQPPEPISAPKDISEIGPAPDMEEIVRENPDCSVDPDEEQSDRCKAIMASLRAQDEIDPDQFDEDKVEDVSESDEPDKSVREELNELIELVEKSIEE